MNYTSCLQCFCFLCLLIYLTWFSNSDCSRPKGGSTDVHIAPPYLVRCTGKYASPTSSFSLPTSTSCSLGWSEVRCFEWRLLQEAFFPVTATRILSLTMKDHNSNFKHSCSPQPTHPITPSLFFLVVNRHTDVHCLITYSFYRHIISPSFSLCLSAAHPHTPICHFTFLHRHHEYMYLNIHSSGMFHVLAPVAVLKWRTWTCRHISSSLCHFFTSCKHIFV